MNHNGENVYPKIKWQNIDISGNLEGGKVNTSASIRKKLVLVVFVSKTNLYHSTSTIFYAEDNNYLITNMYSATEYITINNVTHESFNIIFSGSAIKLKDDEGNELYPNVLDFIYPVGTIYETISSKLNTVAKMNNHFGGSWELFGAGRVTVGYNTSGTFNTVGKTGGAETHTLTTAQMPRHRHSLDSNPATVQSGDSYARPRSAGATGTVGYNTNYEGAGQAHNNLQPYIVVYRYRRIG